MTDVDDPQLTSVLDSLAVRRIRDLLAAREDAVVAIGDDDGHLLWASRPGTYGLLGHASQDLRGRSRFDYVHPDDLALVRRHHRAALDGETTQYAARVRTAEGDWLRVTSTTWAVDAPWGRAVITITTAGDRLAWPHPDGAQR